MSTGGAVSVFVAVQGELDLLGEKANASVEGQTALALAAALDDRAGVQAGGLASTAKQLSAVMSDIRDKYKVITANRLELIKGA
jgi:hypothetical protein